MTKAGHKKVGYWNTTQNTYPEYPMPQDLVDDNWNDREQDEVIHYVTSSRFRSSRKYRGMSACRICGCMNGSSESYDSVYTWPSGFGHYLTEHNVKPPQDFVDHVLSRGEKAL